MWPQSILILVGCILALACGGCGKGKSYPTAPAPPTIKDPPPSPMKSAMGQDDDDDPDDGYEDDEPKRPSRRRAASNFSGGGIAPMVPPMGRAPQTINGHPQGPKAEVFNAVTNNAYSRAAPCFAAHGGSGTTVAKVRMTVVNSGVVEEATVTAGPEAEAFRKCLSGVVKGLAFPAFKGPKVTKTITFTAVTGAR